VPKNGPHQVQLNIPGVVNPIPLQLPPDKGELQRLAMRWSYSLRNRERWTSQSDLLERQQEEVFDVAAKVGLTDQILAQIATTDLVEIEIPFVTEDEGWELRILPWEYILATATRDLRNGSMTVVRYLHNSAPSPKLPAPGTWTYIESAAGRLRASFDFESERKLVQESARDADIQFESVCDPDVDALYRCLESVKSGDVVHFAGFDPHQGLQLLEDESADQVLDGYLVNASHSSRRSVDGVPNRSAASRTQVVAGLQLASQLTSGNRRPRLAAFNIYHSAARTAALSVAKGVDAAIGFQDAFDDGLAELFFATFYRAWRLSEWNTVAAFQHAWTTVRKQHESIEGSGLVLWSGRSIRETLPGYWQSRTKNPDIGSIWTQRVARDRAAITTTNIADKLEVDVKPLAALNYSLLHNDGSLFERFSIRKKSVSVGAVRDLHVRVELHVGTDSYPYRTTVEFGEGDMQVVLKTRAKISLASSLSRALRESVRTSLFIEVRWQETVLYCETFPITLLPIDEWVDTNESRIWLPSFVLPRDPAVARVIDRAQRYLMAISDDPSAGFSGYQAIDSDQPTNAPDLRCEGVDAQVRAIWSALLYELPLNYINPPPVFSDYSQRLRTPSDVVDGGRGTCIDLALLLASCLEYVEIYPVLFLLKDHAFPGYWRDEGYYDSFLAALVGPEVQDAEPGRPTPGSRAVQQYSWYLEQAHFREVLGEIHSGRLVPLETVSLTEHVGFSKAIEQGQANLTSKRQFQAMLDVMSARWDETIHVTPLPLLRS